MQVFLIPVGPDRYEPYCEVDDAAIAPGDAPAARGFVKQWWSRFQEMLHAAERAERERDMADGNRSFGGRLSDKLLGWVAEKVAEQRLLWHLRTQESATLVHPSDLDPTRAQAILRAQLQRDADRHRRWLFIDGALTAVTGPLFFFVPGPNLIAYYFAFRTVGHLLSYRGARHGLDRVQWSDRPSAELTQLRRVGSLPPAQRETQVRAVAAALRLERLAVFLERVVLPGA
jgi:hypothetical protein